MWAIFILNHSNDCQVMTVLRLDLKKVGKEIQRSS